MRFLIIQKQLCLVILGDIQTKKDPSEEESFFNSNEWRLSFFR